MPYLLLFSVFVVATCGLIYELVAGTVASYLLGDSVTQFSTIIGAYLFSMGIGSYFSRFFDRHLIGWFVQVEILVGLVGGTSSSILFLLFEHAESFRIVLYMLVGLTGMLVGLEIPLLMRILKNRFEFKDLVSQVFTFDYIGALLASVIFPLLLIPHLGLIRTSCFFGILNIAVALVVCVKFGREMIWTIYLKSLAVASLILLLLGFVFSETIMSWSEQMAYQDKIIYSKSSPYQRIVLTKNSRELKLFLNGNLQFSSSDEYRYHEALVHPGMEAAEKPVNVLVLGGGDGLAVREILKYPTVRSVTLVDLDKAITDLFRSNHLLTALNKESLSSPKVKIINEDAFRWIKNCRDTFDFIAVDFPDPSNYSVGKLYTNTFYRLLYPRLSSNGYAVIQSTSPFFAVKSFWCINNTLETTGFRTIPYHVFVPSFGDWGYVMITKNRNFQPPLHFREDLKFLNAEAFRQMLVFPRDIAKAETEINQLNNQALVHYFESEWGRYVQ